ncbi:hypothetical protein ACOYXF_23300 [Pseudomonas sp. Tul1A2]
MYTILQVAVFSPELNRFSPVFSYFGQAVFVKKRPFLWAMETQKQEMIVTMLCVVMHPSTLCVCYWDAERPGLRSHAERGYDQKQKDRSL